MNYLLFACFMVWLVVAVTICVSCWNNELAKENKWQLIKCSIFWPFYMIIEL